jgi:hypothetical protein
MNIEFTSRYGPAGPPSWLRGCHGACEAMGFYPVKCEGGIDDVRAAFGRGELTAIQARAIAQRLAEGRVETDGWYFLPCDLCSATGRCSWLTTCRRVPRWIWRGMRTCWEFGPSSSVHCPDWSWSRRMWIAFKVAFLADLGVKM